MTRHLGTTPEIRAILRQVQAHGWHRTAAIGRPTTGESPTPPAGSCWPCRCPPGSRERPQPPTKRFRRPASR